MHNAELKLCPTYSFARGASACAARGNHSLPLFIELIRKKFAAEESSNKLDGLWVEMKNRGLKISVILDSSTY